MEDEMQHGNGYAMVQQSSDEYLASESTERKKPQLNLKANKRFVGSGWLSDGKFGKYISFTAREPIEAGTKVYLSPRKGFEGILG